MTDTDTKIDFALAAAGSQPGDDEPEQAPMATPSSAPQGASSTTRAMFPAVTNVWRGLFTLSLGFALCAIAIAESAGAANAPTWFLGFAIPVLTEWVGEWVVYGRRKTA